jgi:hypothetical protein
MYCPFSCDSAIHKLGLPSEYSGGNLNIAGKIKTNRTKAVAMIIAIVINFRIRIGRPFNTLMMLQQIDK